MQPVLFSILGFEVQTYGVSKAVAAVVAALLLGRAFRRLGLQEDDAHALVLWATVWGFVGAKIYYLLENLPNLTWHHLGGMGFTWYGGLLGGIASAAVIMLRRHLPAATVADAAMMPLSVAYAIGRVGCWLSGDGTYGKPTSLPWGMTVTHGVVPTEVAVHPTPLYEAVAALGIAALLWALSRRQSPPWTVVASYLVLSGSARFAVEFLRINDPALFGLTQPQLWSVASIVAGLVLGVAVVRKGRSVAESGTGKSSLKVDAMPVDSAGPRTHNQTMSRHPKEASVPATESHRTTVTLVHSPACHFCDDAAEALAEIAATYSVDVIVIALESPEGAELVARHRPAMNPLVLLDGEFFSSGRLPRKKLLSYLQDLASAAGTPAPVVVR